MTQPLDPAEFSELTPEQRHDQFIAEATADGKTTVENAENVFKIVTELSPTFGVEDIQAFGMPVGYGAVRVAREYDDELTEHDLEGFTQIQVYTPLGLITFNVRKSDLVAALTVDVPHVSPPATRSNS